jgi:DNA repair protein RadC
MNLFNQQIAEVKISYSHTVKPSNQIKICGSKDMYQRIFPIWPDMDYCESFAVILLSRGNKILGINYTATGGISGCVVDVRKIMQAVLNSNTSGIILVHYAK